MPVHFRKVIPMHNSSAQQVRTRQSQESHQIFINITIHEIFVPIVLFFEAIPAMKMLISYKIAKGRANNN